MFIITELQNGRAFLIQSESKDPVLAIPDSAVWDATGSGSGNEDEDASKTDTVVELKIDNGNTPQIVANAHSPRMEPGKSVEVVEVKDDGEQPLQSETNVASQSKAISPLQSEVEMASKNETKSTSDNAAKLAIKNEAKLTPENEAKSVADLAEDNEVDQPMPKFETLSQELKWKFNKARNDLKKAKQIVQLAEHIAIKKHKGTKSEQEVKDIITKTEIAMVHAGEKMGLDYMHYRRRKRSLSDDEDDFE